MSPQKSEEDAMIKFCKKQSFADVLKNFANFTGNNLVRVSF